MEVTLTVTRRPTPPATAQTTTPNRRVRRRRKNEPHRGVPSSPSQCGLLSQYLPSKEQPDRVTFWKGHGGRRDVHAAWSPGHLSARAVLDTGSGTAGLHGQVETTTTRVEDSPVTFPWALAVTQWFCGFIAEHHRVGRVAAMRSPALSSRSAPRTTDKGKPNGCLTTDWLGGWPTRVQRECTGLMLPRYERCVFFSRCGGGNFNAGASTCIIPWFKYIILLVYSSFTSLLLILRIIHSFFGH